MYQLPPMITKTTRKFVAQNPAAIEEALTMGVTVDEFRAIRREVAYAAVQDGTLDYEDVEWGSDQLEKQIAALGLK